MPETRDLHEFLAALAVVKPLAVGSYSKDPLCDMNLESGDEYNIVVTSRLAGNRSDRLVELVLLCVRRRIRASHDRRPPQLR